LKGGKKTGTSGPDKEGHTMMTLPFRQELMDGKGEPEIIEFRKALPSDIDEVMALQDRVVEALPDKDL
jgi:hypothetical protein